MRCWLNVPHLNYFHTNVLSMRDKREELEALAQSQRCDITGISETWWDGFWDWSDLLEGSRLFWERQRSGTVCNGRVGMSGAHSWQWHS